MRSLHIISVAILAAALASTAAHAAVVEVRYDGVIASGSDLTGVFGAPGGDLSGATFSATYTFDDANPHGGSTYNPPLGSSYQYQLIGPTTDLNDPVVAITINGVTVEVGCLGGFGDFCNLALQNLSGAGGVWGVSAAESLFAVDTTVPRTWNRNLSLGITSTTDPFVTNFDYHTALTHTFQPGDVATGSLTLTDHVVGVGADPGHYNENVTASLTPLSVTISSPAAVPEPGSWLLMITGFGVIGAAMRYRKRLERAAASGPAAPSSGATEDAAPKACSL